MALANIARGAVSLSMDATLTMPVSFIWGADDPTFPEPLAREMTRQCPNIAGFTSVRDGKLFFCEEQPELVARLVVEAVSGS